MVGYKMSKTCNIYVVVQLYPRKNLIFSLLWCMVICDAEYKTKGTANSTKSLNEPLYERLKRYTH